MWKPWLPVLSVGYSALSLQMLVCVLVDPTISTSSFNFIVFTPRACTRGKVIGRVVVVVSTKITIFRDVGVQATRKHDESIEFGEKLASVCVESRDTVHDRHK